MPREIPSHATNAAHSEEYTYLPAENALIVHQDDGRIRLTLNDLDVLFHTTDHERHVTPSGVLYRRTRAARHSRFGEPTFIYVIGRAMNYVQLTTVDIADLTLALQQHREQVTTT
jgi:hypothetical protein